VLHCLHWTALRVIREFGTPSTVTSAVAGLCSLLQMAAVVTHQLVAERHVLRVFHHVEAGNEKNSRRDRSALVA
jgi:hypothetical protein